MNAADAALYLLVRYYDANCQHHPKAVGPFPSVAMCRAAGRDIDPSDRRFWTAEERQAADAADKAAQAARDSRFDALRKSQPSKDGWYYVDREARHYNAKGEQDAIGSTGGGGMSMCPTPPTIISDCVTTFDPEMLAR